MDRLSAAGVLASEMEATHLFVLAAVYGGHARSVAVSRSPRMAIRVGAICAIIGTPEDGIAPLNVEEAAEEQLIAVALAGVARLAAGVDAQGPPGADRDRLLID